MSDDEILIVKKLLSTTIIIPKKCGRRPQNARGDTKPVTRRLFCLLGPRLVLVLAVMGCQSPAKRVTERGGVAVMERSASMQASKPASASRGIPQFASLKKIGLGTGFDPVWACGVGLSQVAVCWNFILR